ncbi:hypothetical protein V1478_006386 [Vespula squamosa]|uniref:Uncharacterized protein n=1 Tax=Vespula squamosa TaxID=30214 RepID=A0ABD2B7P7_VESSQ
MSIVFNKYIFTNTIMSEKNKKNDDSYRSHNQQREKERDTIVSGKNEEIESRVSGANEKLGTTAAMTRIALLRTNSIIPDSYTCIWCSRFEDQQWHFMESKEKTERKEARSGACKATVEVATTTAATEAAAAETDSQPIDTSVDDAAAAAATATATATAAVETSHGVHGGRRARCCGAERRRRREIR